MDGGHNESTLEQRWAAMQVFYKGISFFDPLPPQIPVLCSEASRNIFVGGVGSGKSLTAAGFAVPRIKPSVLGHRQAHYWLVGENFEIPRTEFDYIWEIYGEYGVPIPVHNTPKEGRWEMEVPVGPNQTALIETKSWTNPESLHAKPVQGIVVCEAGLLRPDIWFERLEPRLARVPGSWALLCGTLEDSGPFFKDLVRQAVVEKESEDWVGWSMATWENTYVYPGGVDDPVIVRLRKVTPPDIFLERYAAIPKTVAALVYREFSHTYHVGRYKFDRNQPVYIGIDPGGVYALNAFQIHGKDAYIIDEIHGEQWSSEKVIEEATGRPWWKKASYGVIDATQEEAEKVWTDGKIWQSLGKKPIPIHSQKVSVQGGIELVRTFLHSGEFEDDTPPELVFEFQGKRGVARLHVDARCEETIYEFTQGYKRKRLVGGEYSEDVVKRSDHHMDLIRYFLAHYFGFTAPSRPAARKRRWVDSRPSSVWR